MHSAPLRLCARRVSHRGPAPLTPPSIFVLYKFVNAVFILAAMATVVGVAHQYRAPALDATVEAKSLAAVPGSPFVDMRFSLDVDVSPLFGWNTNQVFVYVTLERDEIPGFPGASSYLTVFDHVVTRPEDGHLVLDGAQLRLSVETDPRVGLLLTRRFEADGPLLKLGQ